MSFYQKNTTYVLSYAQSPNAEKKKQKNMGINMLLSWKTLFFQPSAHF